LLDLLSTRVAEADAKRPTDPAHALDAWRAAGYRAETSLSPSAAAEWAHAVGAGEVVIGSLRMAGPDVVVHATLVDASTARIRSESDVRGSSDSLLAISDRLITGLILREAGVRAPSLPQLAVSPAGLRSYLRARALYRRAEYQTAMREYAQALALAPHFAPAGLGLAMAADRVNAAEQHDRGLAVAWSNQDQLSEGERAFLYAFAGPHYPQPSSAADVLDAWERVVHAEPDRPEGWFELGEGFYYDGDLLGMNNALPRAGQALQHALAIDPSYGPAKRMLALLLARQRDTVALRHLVDQGAMRDTSDALNVFVRWRVAQALGDARELARVRAEFDQAPSDALRNIAMTGQFDGIAVQDGDRAIAILQKRNLSDAELSDLALARHSRALNAGDYAGALAITRELGSYQPALHPQLRLRILDALYSRGDRTAASSAVAELDRRASMPATTAADSAVRLADLCVLGQWRLAQNDTSGARAAVRPLLASSMPRFTVPVEANPITCGEMLDVSLAVAEHGVAARPQLAHFDSLMLSGPAVGDAMRYVGRDYLRIGEPALGLAALRRRSFMRGWPRYRATGLQLQADLATALGDTAAAHSARERLNSTR
jgi:tetratricopeptide (TPR) repeat protein